SGPAQEGAVFVSVMQRFAELRNAEHDVPSREHLLDMLGHLRWQAARLRRMGPDAPLDVSALNFLDSVLPSLQGLSNSTELDAPVLAILDLCDLFEPRCADLRRTLDLGSIHAHRGKALLNLSAWEAGTVRLQRALEQTQKALDIYRRPEHPSQWAQLQDNLGLILSRLGERAGETSEGERLLGAAETAFKAGLQGCRRNEQRVEWARTQNHLANALVMLGQLERPSDRSVQHSMAAVDAHGRALEAYSMRDEPGSWAVTIMNRGLALMRLGQDTGRADYLSEAVADLRASLEVYYTKADTPLRWATVQYSLACALYTLASLRAGRDRADLFSAAASAARGALEVVTRKEQPTLRAAAHLALGRALSKQASQRTSQRLLKEAAAAFRAALAIFSESV